MSARIRVASALVRSRPTRDNVADTFDEHTNDPSIRAAHSALGARDHRTIVPHPRLRAE